MKWHACLEHVTWRAHKRKGPCWKCTQLRVYIYSKQTSSLIISVTSNIQVYAQYSNVAYIQTIVWLSCSDAVYKKNIQCNSTSVKAHLKGHTHLGKSVGTCEVLLSPPCSKNTQILTLYNRLATSFSRVERAHCTQVSSYCCSITQLAQRNLSKHSYRA